MAEAVATHEARCRPELRNARTLRPGYVPVFAVVDYERRGGESRREPGDFEILPEHAVALLDCILHCVSHRLRHPVPAGKAPRVADEIGGRADEHRSLETRLAVCQR